MLNLKAFVKKPDQSSEKNHHFLTDVIDGLSKQQKSLPCKYFYDEVGSKLFEKICETSEYYVTRTECKIYHQRAAEIAELIGPQALIIEPGAGSVQKIAILLDHLPNPAGFIPMDISAEVLSSSSESLSALFPNIDVVPMVVDFLDEKLLRDFFHYLLKKSSAVKRVIFFPGSTIGNLQPDQCQKFLANFASNLSPGDGLLIGVDLIKETDILESAYNDREGITADFNLNLLHRLSKELHANINIDAFSHRAFFNKSASRIEMHLVSESVQSIELNNQVFNLLENETIHTEHSYKYDIKGFSKLAEKAGFGSKKIWTDDQALFSVHYLQVN